MVDGADLEVWRDQFGFVATSVAAAGDAAGAVPEPAAGLLAIGALAMVGRQRRR